MAEDPAPLDLIDLLRGLLTIIAEHQVHLLAIEAYVAEQPGYLPARFGTLVEEFRTDPQKTTRLLESSRAALTKLLAAFEGPPQ